MNQKLSFKDGPVVSDFWKNLARYLEEAANDETPLVLPDVKEARAAGACHIGEKVPLAANRPYEPRVDRAVQDLFDLLWVEFILEDL